MRIQQLLSTLLLGLSLLTMLVLGSGCAKEGCTNEFADNYDMEATKDDGSCVLAREKFIGQYKVNENCPSGNFTFDMGIVASSNGDNLVIINNFADFSVSVNGEISGNTLTIPSQNVTISGVAVTINGSGAINGNLLIINYTYNFSGGGESCSMNCTRQ